MFETKCLKIRSLKMLKMSQECILKKLFIRAKLLTAEETCWVLVFF